MNTEFEAVIAVRQVLNRTNYLESFIDENDKTPVWDGSILVYGDSKIPHSKTSLRGRVPVQVKGRLIDTLPVKEIKFAVNLDDLRGFKSEGGAIFFVVFITKDYKKKIYYSNLLTIDIERFLQKSSKQKQVSISFSPFPNDKGVIMSIFLSFLANRERQMGTVDTKKLYMDQWDDSEGESTLGTLTIPIITYNDPDRLPFELATSSPQYIYTSPKDFEHILIPVDRMDSMVIGYTETGTIKIDEAIYYQEYEIIWQEGAFSFNFGKGLSMSFERVENRRESHIYKIDMNLQLKGTLKERIKDVEFFIHYFDKKNVSIKSIKFPLNDITVGSKDEIDTIRKLYKRLTDLQIKLNILGIEEDLDIDELKKTKTNEEWKIDMILQIGEEAKSYPESKNKNTIQILEVANIRILLFVDYKAKKQSFSDFYTPSIEIIAKDVEGDGEDLFMSQYVILKKNDLTVSNFKFESVYNNIVKYELNEYYLNQVNLFLLEVIKAYDSKEGKSNELYRLSVKLSEWLISNDDNILFYMNYLQVIKREKMITREDQNILKKYLIKYQDDWRIYTGILILLNRKKEARKILAKQKLEDQLKFKDYPIYMLLD